MVPQSSTSAPLLLLSRVLLLVAVLTGLGAMHVLDSASGSAHGSTSMAAVMSTETAPGHTGTTAPAAVDTTTVGPALSPSSAGDHGLMTGCTLFAATGIALLGGLLTAAAARRDRIPAEPPLLHDLLGALAAARRGPPPWPWPRIALCVIRI